MTARRTSRRRVLPMAAALVLLATACGATTGNEAGRGTGDRGAAAAPSTPSTTSGAHGSHSGGATATATTAPLRADERFVDLVLPEAYKPRPPTGGTDDYRCFLLDPSLARDAVITGTDVLPGTPGMVHHAILFRVPPGQVAQAQRVDDTTHSQGWTCFGGAGLPSQGTGLSALDDAPWLAAWAPGGTERVLGSGVGVPLEAGSKVVLQVHYNLLAESGSVKPDRTAVRLRVVDAASATGRSLEPLRTTLLVAPVELPCAPGETGELCDRAAAVQDVSARFGGLAAAQSAGLQILCGGDPFAPRAGATQTCDRRVAEAGVVRAAAGHMHLLGRSIRVVANPGTARARTVLDVPTYDFDDQGARTLAAPARVAAGDTLRVTCTHDARLRGMLPELRGTPPRYVVWGEGTADEMCLAVVLWTRR